MTPSKGVARRALVEVGHRNVWFGNVELITTERIGRETVTYVRDIYEYYVAYRLLAEENARRTDSRAALKTSQVTRRRADSTKG